MRLMAGRRRIDRILDEGYLADLASVSAADLRARVKDCRIVDEELSMLRTWLHAKLDIIRSGLEASGDEAMVGRLTEVLSRDTPTRRGARVHLPSGTPLGVQRSLDRLVSEAHLARLPDMSEPEVAEIVDALTAEEQRVSAQRRQVLDVLDAVEAELVKRYQEGGADPADLLHPKADG